MKLPFEAAATPLYRGATDLYDPPPALIGVIE